MRLITVVLLALTAGWGLGWYSHQRWAAVEQRVVVVADQSVRDATSLASHLPAEADTGIGALLKRNNFTAAIERYETLQLEADEMAAADARVAILVRARALLAARDYDSASQLLLLFVAIEYRDVEAMALLADVYSAQKQYREAIEQLYAARGYAWRTDVLNHLSGRIRAMVDEQTLRLQHEQNNSALLDLYQRLTRLEPEYAPYFIALANAQLALDDEASARNSLLLVSRDPDVGPQAQAMLAKLQPAEEQPAEQLAGIPLEKKGRHFLVDASAGGASAIRLLIDTGASLTIFSSRMIRNSGMVYRDTGKVGVFNTANGRVEAPVYVVDSLVIGDWQVRDLKVGVLDMDSQNDIDGLLGMNFLQHFRFFIDQDEAVLHLSLQ